tara:strand:- start:16 stop:717 length:702 start_codon:yes stop_codon:yes gene_type:complete
MAGGIASLGLRDFYNKLPVNIRTFAETALGNTSPITEEDFSDEDLQFYRAEYEKKKAANEREEADLRARLEEAELEAPLDKLTEAELDQPATGFTSSEGREDIKRKIASHDRTRGKTSMSPADYASEDYVHEGGWVKSMVQSFTDPSYRAGTTLSRFDVIQQEDGSVSIQDTYNWTAAPENISLEEFLGALKAVKSPEQLGNLFMRLLKPDTNREVDIRLPDKYSTGGRIRLI